MRCENIIVVEDDPDVQRALREILEFEGFRVIAANNGKEALEIVRTDTTPCLILLDLMMPVMNGWEFLEIKNRETHMASIPVVIVSAAGDQEKLKAAGKGRPDVKGQLKKPYDIDTLLTMCHKICD